MWPLIGLMTKPPTKPRQPQQDSKKQPSVVKAEWAGPLPPPQALERFNQIVPNGAERIFKMAEEEQAHRIAFEKAGLQASIAEAKRGQFLGFTISLAAIVAAVGSAWLGAHFAVSLALIGVPIMGLAKAIVDARSRDPS